MINQWILVYIASVLDDGTSNTNLDPYLTTGCQFAKLIERIRIYSPTRCNTGSAPVGTLPKYLFTCQSSLSWRPAPSQSLSMEMERNICPKSHSLDRWFRMLENLPFLRDPLISIVVNRSSSKHAFDRDSHTGWSCCVNLYPARRFSDGAPALLD